MNLSRCDNGHFYDKEKYASCPHCAGGVATDQSLTSVFVEDAQVPAATSEPMMPGAEVFPANNAVTAPLQDPSGLPVASMSADQMTVAMGSNLDMPTVPLEQEVIDNPFDDMGQHNIVTEGVDSAEDHTVAYFDDIFSNAAPASSVAPATSPMPQSHRVNKVSTPCVGWLIAIGGNHVGTDFRLKVGKNFIGRNQNMDISLTEDKSVSRDRHAIVVYEPKEHLYLVQPGESSSLVYKNNKVVLSPETLEAYDVVTVGEVNLLFMPLCGTRFSWSDLLKREE